MGKWHDSVSSMQQRHADAWTEMELSFYKVIYTNDGKADKPDADGVRRPGDPASPQDAYNSALLITPLVNKLSTLFDEMGLREKDRKEYWKGPASEAFGRIFNGYYKYVSEVVAAVLPSDQSSGYVPILNMTGGSLELAHSKHNNAHVIGVGNFNQIKNTMGFSLHESAEWLDRWGPLAKVFDGPQYDLEVNSFNNQMIDT